MVYARRKKLYGPLFQDAEPLTRGATIPRNRVYSALFREQYSTEQEKPTFGFIKSFHVSELSIGLWVKGICTLCKVRAFREKKIYGCDSSRCNYYEETPFRPDLLLQELAALFHPGLFPDYRFRYYQPLSE